MKTAPLPIAPLPVAQICVRNGPYGPRLREPRSARQRNTSACLPPLKNCRKSGARAKNEDPPPMHRGRPVESRST
eukprot:4943818-Prymnesium_polylepis.1